MFQAKLKSETLKGVVDVVSTLIDEAKFKIDANGISLKAVDPAHVAMIDLHLDKAAFEQYSASETELGIEGLARLVSGLCAAQPGEGVPLPALEETLLKYCGQVHLPDDLTLLSLRRLPGTIRAPAV